MTRPGAGIQWEYAGPAPRPLATVRRTVPRARGTADRAIFRPRRAGPVAGARSPRTVQRTQGAPPEAPGVGSRRCLRLRRRFRDDAVRLRRAAAEASGDLPRRNSRRRGWRRRSLRRCGKRTPRGTGISRGSPRRPASPRSRPNAFRPRGGVRGGRGTGVDGKGGEGPGRRRDGGAVGGVAAAAGGRRRKVRAMGGETRAERSSRRRWRGSSTPVTRSAPPCTASTTSRGCSGPSCTGSCRAACLTRCTSPGSSTGKAGFPPRSSTPPGRGIASGPRSRGTWSSLRTIRPPGSLPSANGSSRRCPVSTASSFRSPCCRRRTRRGRCASPRAVSAAGSTRTRPDRRFSCPGRRPPRRWRTGNASRPNTASGRRGGSTSRSRRRLPCGSCCGWRRRRGTTSRGGA